MREFEGRNYINGEWRAPDAMYTKINPATGKAQGAFPLSNKSEVQKALVSARKAFKKWKKVKSVCVPCKQKADKELLEKLSPRQP